MLRIAICDDESCLGIKIFIEKDISSEIDMFNSGKELLGLGTDTYNIIFLTLIWMR